MLDAADTPTIRNALHKRLDREPGVRIVDIKFRKPGDCVAVHVALEVGALHLTSDFELPVPFEHSHLLNEIDEIAEHAKRAHREFWLAGRPAMIGRQAIVGTGLRGGWARYG